MTNNEIKALLQIVYTKMTEILTLHEQTHVSATIPKRGTERAGVGKGAGTGEGVGIGVGEEEWVVQREEEQERTETETDIKRLMDRKQVEILRFISVNFRDEEQLCPVLFNILDELTLFIESCEIPGVVPRWRKINPRIEYYDAAFEIVEQSREIKSYVERGLCPEYFCVRPSSARRKKRKEYFAEKQRLYEKQGKIYSENRVFHEELLQTLCLVFYTDFAYYMLIDDTMYPTLSF